MSIDLIYVNISLLESMNLVQESKATIALCIKSFIIKSYAYLKSNLNSNKFNLDMVI